MMIRTKYLKRFLYIVCIIIFVQMISYMTMEKDTSDELNGSGVYRKYFQERNIWFHKRKLLLKSSSHKKVLLFCYMRGGSTFFSELFRQNPEVMYWYEPIDAFYMANYGMKSWHFPQDIFWYQHGIKNSSQRIIHHDERESLAHFNHNLLSCNFSWLPTELLLHPSHNKTSTKPFQQCAVNQTKKIDMTHCNQTEKNIRYICAKENLAKSLRNKCPHYLKEADYYVSTHSQSSYEDFISRGNTAPEDFFNYAKCSNNIKKLVLNECVYMLKSMCEKSKLVTYKGLRLTMNSVAAMLKKDPDMHIVYLIRDPRSTVLSRVQIRHTYRDTANHPAAEAMFHCRKILQDFLLYKKLDQLYPGAFFLVKFEDLILNRYKVTEDIYNFLGTDVHDSVYTWMKENERKKESGGKHSTYRSNSTAVIDKWKTVTSKDAQLLLTNICKDAIQELGYPL